MNKLNTFIIGTKLKLNNAIEDKLGRMLAKKGRGDETLIIKVMLIVVAVFLVLIFRNTLKDIMDGLLTTVKTKIEGMFTA